jgi:hypothetical protein
VGVEWKIKNGEKIVGGRGGKENNGTIIKFKRKPCNDDYKKFTRRRSEESYSHEKFSFCLLQARNYE